MSAGFPPRRLAAVALATLCLPAAAETQPSAARRLVDNYVNAWNAGDVERLVTEIYAEQTPETRQRLSADIDALRRQDFGRIDLYSVHECPLGGERILADVRFAYLYTFGGLMPPGDQLRRLELSPGASGLRIISETSLPFALASNCPD
jgi:hypothetical protein